MLQFKSKIKLFGGRPVNILVTSVLSATPLGRDEIVPTEPINDYAGLLWEDQKCNPESAEIF